MRKKVRKTWERMKERNSETKYVEKYLICKRMRNKSETCEKKGCERYLERKNERILGKMKERKTIGKECSKERNNEV